MFGKRGFPQQQFQQYPQTGGKGAQQVRKSLWQAKVNKWSVFDQRCNKYKDVGMDGRCGGVATLHPVAPPQRHLHHGCKGSPTLKPPSHTPSLGKHKGRESSIRLLDPAACTQCSIAEWVLRFRSPLESVQGRAVPSPSIGSAATYTTSSSGSLSGV